jgi:hypothetical protein
MANVLITNADVWVEEEEFLESLNSREKSYCFKWLLENYSNTNKNNKAEATDYYRLLEDLKHLQEKFKERKGYIGFKNVLETLTTYFEGKLEELEEE